MAVFGADYKGDQGIRRFMNDVTSAGRTARRAAGTWAVRAPATTLRGSISAGKWANSTRFGTKGFFNPGSTGRALMAGGATYLGPAAFGGAIGFGLGYGHGLGVGGPEMAMAQGVRVGALGALGGGITYGVGARRIFGAAGKMGLSTVGIAGGMAEILGGYGARQAIGLAGKGVGLVGKGTKYAPKRLGVMGAGGILGGLAGSALGGTTGATLFGSAVGAIAAPGLGRIGTGGLGGLLMRRPVATIMAGSALFSGLKVGKMVIESALGAEAPDAISAGSWNEVYGMSSDHGNTSGLSLAAHYARR